MQTNMKISRNYLYLEVFIPFLRNIWVSRPLNGVRVVLSNEDLFEAVLP